MPPEQPHGTPPAKQRSAVLVGVLIGVLVFALIGLVVVGAKVISNALDQDDASAERPSPSASPKEPLPATDPKLAAYYDQKLSWRGCGSNDCATLQVPLDYAKPAGEKVGIAVLKVPAGDRSERVGSLVVNPGGPGGSGVQFAAAGKYQFGNDLADHFDIVGFDPRGVGRSDPITCGGTSELDELMAMDPDPDDEAERDRMTALTRQFGNSCVAGSGDLVQHISTQEAARDMDILRAALGEPKLDYFGFSYGTYLGATYAELFPTNVGRFVLDGAVDPSLSNAELSLEQARGFETALRAYVKDCVDDDGCILGSTVDQGTARIRELLDQLEKEPLPTGGDRELTEGLGMMGIWLPLYAKERWPDLTDALTQAIEDDRGDDLLALADLYASRGDDGYTDNSMAALLAVNCLDHGDSIATEAVPAEFAKFEAASPTFGRAFAFSLSTCSSWPVKPVEPELALTAKGAPPIVVIGTTRDPATPLVWAQALAAQLDSGQLITRDGDGHTGFRQGSECVDDAVQGWLVSGRVPKPDLKCGP
ncbi:alpha/beta hydrolase [Nocardioides marmoriginsengisoli]|uniref:Alpha/beta hydrolase n=2 Tax=Nocardioides marmoriginsengisoli TaxID=661483 RepID=A0A3N0CJ16_9ACTN|nr:alpha/beta hydrolase [Nocardioides marmoriginsengisoli]